MRGVRKNRYGGRIRYNLREPGQVAKRPCVGAVVGGSLAAMLLFASLCGVKAQHEATILSEGASTCGEYTAEPAKQIIRASWVLGYISGANSRAPMAEAFAGSSFQMPATVVGWLQSYCASHPLDVMVTAAEALRRDFLTHERR
jgi:hypothetical protein